MDSILDYVNMISLSTSELIDSVAGVRAMEWGRSDGDLLPIIRTEGAPICHINNSKSFIFCNSLRRNARDGQDRTSLNLR